MSHATSTFFLRNLIHGHELLFFRWATKSECLQKGTESVRLFKHPRGPVPLGTSCRGGVAEDDSWMQIEEHADGSKRHAEPEHAY